MHPLQSPAKSRPAKYPTDEAKWRAVLQKDPGADRQFYFSVRTTRVYCLPSCPARAALRKNVAFHNSAADAESAGFRPCKRCRPAGPAIEAVHGEAVARVCRLIETAEQPPTLDEMAASAHMSASHFHRLFKAATGLTPKAYAVAHRSRRVREQLVKCASVTEAIYQSGFNSNGRFYAKSSETLGMQPRAFRNGGAGTTIRFAVGECSLGSILVAASQTGICAILLGDDPGPLLKDLQDRFPKSDLLGADPAFESTIAQVIGLVEAPHIGLNLPLDVRGTAFQQRVWQALREIPAGSTVSYTQLSQRIGLPGAVRAVAGACGANPLAVAIPCHRVLRLNGGLSGYRWGIERKRALLLKEKAAAL